MCPHIQHLLVKAMSDWYLEREPLDPTKILSILEMAKELEVLPIILTANNFPFVIELACWATKRDFLKLEKWFSEKIREYKVFCACVSYSMPPSSVTCVTCAYENASIALIVTHQRPGIYGIYEPKGCGCITLSAVRVLLGGMFLSNICLALSIFLNDAHLAMHGTILERALLDPTRAQALKLTNHIGIPPPSLALPASLVSVVLQQNEERCYCFQLFLSDCIHFLILRAPQPLTLAHERSSLTSDIIASLLTCLNTFKRSNSMVWDINMMYP